ncbi:hypothetical protein V1478_004391 [Vespula squamosa]|uniref:Uncharacterized protein n=1 Tax=Vespula squamosa TaxID=30214 RepID=A0ABD2BH53_VESSQ
MVFHTWENKSDRATPATKIIGKTNNIIRSNRRKLPKLSKPEKRNWGVFQQYFIGPVIEL